MATLTPNSDAEVSVTELGILSSKGDTRASSTGASSHDFTVPAGKKWVLKGTSATASATFATDVQIFASGGDAINVRVHTAESFTANKYDTFIFPQGVTLVAGEKVRISLTATSATGAAALLYQEMNA